MMAGKMRYWFYSGPLADMRSQRKVRAVPGAVRYSRGEFDAEDGPYPEGMIPHDPDWSFLVAVVPELEDEPELDQDEPAPAPEPAPPAPDAPPAK